MSGFETRHVETKVHGRYLVRPAAGRPPAGALVGFHGYGEDAGSILAELVRIPGAEAWQVAAVQALHPFYKRSGEVVASWMTRLDRELAIADNRAYVGRAVERILDEAGSAGPLVYAGFSQGVAMAYRAAAGAGRRCDGLIALGGDVPPELAELDLDGLPPVLLGRGRDDDWYSSDKLANDLELLAAKGVAVETVVFEGGHEWTDGFRNRCGGYLAARTGG